MRLAEPALAFAAALALGCAPVAPVVSPGSGAPSPREMTVVAAAPAAPATAPPLANAPAPAPRTPPREPAAAPPSPTTASTASSTNDTLLAQLLGNGGAVLKKVLASPEVYRFQVLYGVVGPGSTPTFERHGYRVDAEYFFPASSMKVPITLATYDRLATLRAQGKGSFKRDATVRIHPVSGDAEPYVTTVARETWRALIVSDNFSANRLLGVVGHREAHETLWSFGLKSARIHTGFATGAEIDPAQMSPRVEFALEAGGAEELAARRSDLVLPPTDAKSLDIGKASIVDGVRVERPLSFADKNAIRLRELQDALVRILRPELLVGAPAGAAAANDDLAYVRQALGTLPSESGLAGFERNVVADYQLIPFLRGIERVKKRGHFEIYSKVGQAFGFLIGNAYVVDKDTGRAFFLTAAIYADPDETINDDNYAYDTISFPALADVAEAVSRHAFTP
jgi:hypothetical protein